LHSAVVSTKCGIVIGEIITTVARFLGVKPNPEDRVSESERLDQAIFEIMNFCKVKAECLCWIYPGDRLLPLPNIDRTAFFHRLTFLGYLAMTRLFDLYPIIQPLTLVKLDLVLPLNHPLLIVLTSKTPLDPFKRSKFPSKHLLLLRAPLFETLSKSAMMSFVGCLCPRHNISKTIGHIYRPGEIDRSPMASHLILHHNPFSDCYVLLPFPFSILRPH